MTGPELQPAASAELSANKVGHYWINTVGPDSLPKLFFSSQVEYK
jgi:hypothetical protein